MAKILLLIVEDEVTLAQMYTTKLEKEGFLVEVAHDGQEGFAMMKSERPSLVLMDILMPNFDGLEALSRAKADPDTRHIPIIVLTNMSDTAYVDRAMKEGAAGYVVKTETTPGEMIGMIKNVLKLPKSKTKREK